MGNRGLGEREWGDSVGRGRRERVGYREKGREMIEEIEWVRDGGEE